MCESSYDTKLYVFQDDGFNLICIGGNDDSDCENYLDSELDFNSEIGYDYYSGSPSWDMRNNLTWYKKINNNSIIAEYNKNISFFIMGNNECNFEISDIDKINKLTEYFIDYSSNIPLRDRLESIKFPTKFPFNEIQIILNKVKNFDDLIINYVDSRISDFWGMPNHHVCLSKTQSL